MVGGPAAGRVIKWDEKQGPFIRIVEHPDFLGCRACSGDIAPEETFHQVAYKVHKIQFDEGHWHWYATPDGRDLITLMNEVWDGYAAGIK